MASRPEKALDQQRWLRLWSQLGAQGNGRLIFDQLVTAYAEPERTYHTLEHIEDCLSELEDSRTLARWPNEVEAGLWFHDAVYVPGATDNEVRSADLVQRILRQAMLPQDVVDRIAALVLVTRHVSPPEGQDEQLICDIDLAVLGREPAVFEEFERRIRREYGWVPEPVYRRERSAVLAGFLARPSIYSTERFRRLYESRARANIARLLGELKIT
jgi:predicted metal-dependent HD superfamily phosphohydrolase